MNDANLPHGVHIICAKCHSYKWMKRPPERRNKAIIEHLDLECGCCGAEYCAKNRQYQWNDGGYKYDKDKTD